jgi:precorrin-2 C20-methyltransferase/precorrin-3B C17-methyltransferase
MSAGRLFGVGVGPGDPELITLKARRIIEAAQVIAYPGAQHGRSVARRIASPFIRPDQIEVALRYPVTTEETDHPGGYDAALNEFYDEAAAQLASHLFAGRDVAVLCAGDPFLYGSYMYLHERLAQQFETTVVPGVTSFSAAAAAAGAPLVKRDDVLSIVPGTLPPEQLEQRLRASDAAVVLKLGRTFERVREAALRAGVAERAVYVERASSDAERQAALLDVEGKVPYMSLVLVPSADRTHLEPPDADAGRGSVTVVGLGPGAPEWITPEAARALSDAEHLVGYGPYLARVPARAGQHRHASDNREEAARARHALSLASSGARVAVVSSGDPGIFAMASALLEQLEAVNGDGSLVEVRVVPGLSAMQAAAARVGAPLGHDFCVISLSDRLKPWQAIERRLDAAGAADLVLALYNPASRTRREQLLRALEVIGRHRAPATPVVMARAVGSPEESVAVTSLGELDSAAVDMRTLLIVGSSTTRVTDAGAVYTPRWYPSSA